MDEQVNIRLNSTANTQGFDQIGGAAKNASAGLEASAKSSKELAGSLGRSVEAGSATVGLFQNIATASQGGAAGIAAAARAGLGFGQMLKGLLAGAGPIGIALAAVGVAAGALMAAFQKPKESTEGMSRALEEAKKSADGLAKAYSGDLSSAIKQISTDATDAINWQKQLAAAHEEVAKAADNQAKAEIDLKQKQGKLTESQASAQKAGVDASAEARQAKNRIDAIRIERDAMQRALDDAQSIAGGPRDALESLLSGRDRSQERQRSAVTAGFELTAAQSRMRDAIAGRNAAAGKGLEADSASLAEWKAARSALDAAEAQYRAAAEAAPSAEAIDELDKSITQAWENWRTASESVSELDKKTRALSKTLELREKTEADVLAKNRRTRAAEATPDPTTDQKAARQQRIDQLKRRGRSVVDNQIAGGAEIDEATYTEAFGAAAWAKRPKSLYSAPAGQAGGESSKTAEAIGDAAKAAESMDTGAGTAEKAAELKKNMEASAAAQKQFADATQAGLATAAAVASELAASVSQAMSATMQTRAELSQLKAQIATMRNRSAQ